jgi:hypothetical protein
MKSRKSIRKMTPIARKVAHICREIHSIQTHLDHVTDLIQEVELENRAWERSQQARNERKEKNEPSEQSGNTTEPQVPPAGESSLE